jgi:hypothetical protein
VVECLAAGDLLVEDSTLALQGEEVWPPTLAEFDVGYYRRTPCALAAAALKESNAGG